MTAAAFVTASIQSEPNHLKSIEWMEKKKNASELKCSL